MSASQGNFRNGWCVGRIIKLQKKQHKLNPWDVLFTYTLSNMKGDTLDFIYKLPDIRKDLPQLIKDLTILSDTKEWCEFKLGEERGMRVIEGIRQITEQEQAQEDAQKARLII